MLMQQASAASAMHCLHRMRAVQHAARTRLAGKSGVFCVLLDVRLDMKRFQTQTTMFLAMAQGPATCF